MYDSDFDGHGVNLGREAHLSDNFTLNDINLHNLLSMGIPGVPPVGRIDNGSSPLGFPPNMTEEDIQRMVRDQYKSMRLSIFDEATQTALIVAFAVLILFGACGNGLVCYVVAKNPNMRTPRNIFIINLAISDLTLCCFTQPFNLLKVSMTVWNLGGFMCKFVPMFAGTNVFVSTISITAIALDRFQVIVYPTKDSMRRFGAAIALISIWIISLLMASPLLIFNVRQRVELLPGMVLYHVCVENPGMRYEKAAYSIASMVFQYIVPIAIVTVAHARICNKLKYRMINQNVSHVSANVNSFQKRKNEREARRKRKTNMLLVMIAVIFISSWLPLNVFNILADFHGSLLQHIDRRNLVFPICHLLVLSSACMNPVLYGWLNDNFRKEFVSVLCCRCCLVVQKACRRCRGGHPRDVNGSQGREMTSVKYQKANNGMTTADTLMEPTAMELKVTPPAETSVSNIKEP